MHFVENGQQAQVDVKYARDCAARSMALAVESTSLLDAVKAVLQDIDHHGEGQELIPDHIGSAADDRAGKRKYIDPELRDAMAGKGTVLPLG